MALMQRWAQRHCEVILDVKTTDRYGRTVAEVISDINIASRRR